jgi:uncharacterized protein
MELLPRLKKSRDYWKLLGDIWTDSENLYQIPSYLLRGLMSSGQPNRRYMMDDYERKIFRRLPDEVRVYRGHSQHNRLGFSWTIDIHMAWWFARRFGLKRGDGVVTGLVSKDQIKALFLHRNEKEVVVLPEDVREIRKVRERLTRRSKYLDAIFQSNWDQAALNKGTRTCHGIEHWNKVDFNAVTLARLTPGTDMQVVRLFAAFHDCKRVSEGHCLEHGRWAADYVRELYEKGGLELTRKQLETLTYACVWHDHGKVSNDPTIGVCWDADRLDLVRVGTIPRESLLSTRAGKSLICKI